IKNQTAEETLLTLQLTEKLLRKILSIMSDQEIISDLGMAHHKMAKWADLGYWFLEKLETLALKLKKVGNKSNIKKYLESTTIQEIKCHLKIVLLNVGFCLTDAVTNDLELFFAEKYLEQAERINVCDLPHLNVNTFSKLVNPCGRAVIAYKLHDLYNFFSYLDETTANYFRFHPAIELTKMTLYFSVLLRLSIIAKDTLEQKLPHLAVKYHNNIKKIFECAESDERFKKINIVGNENFLKDKAEFIKLADQATQNLQAKIRDALTNTFLSLKLRVFAIQDSFAIFIPLEKLPNRKVFLHLPIRLKTLFAIDKIHDNDLVGNTKITGIRIILFSFDINEIIPAISTFLELIEQASNNNKVETNVALASLNKLSFQENNNNVSTLETSAIMQEAHVAQKSNIKTKIKKSKDSKSPIKGIPAPKVLETLHAHDFGFHTEDNPEVTPIYFSTQGQKAQKPTVFVHWKGIPKVEEKIENLFKAMLNPTIEGLVTVGVRNQAGAKIFLSPQALGDDWNLCGLRFKRKGNGAGWLRAIAIPEERVTVDLPDGKKQNRYLFTLGKAKNK
ncbi:MAG TPA: hypothetical protein VFP93_03330, partial [Gammaproteobacteria bacterium]|nr:hypothetical protein [Gammaproteobacteria bacterium]